jgi:hypothetical protein
MELGTFGAIMKFALEIESEVSSFYESVSRNAKDPKLSGLFGELYSRGQKRIKTLERIRRENVTEMILEPIIGFNSETYKPETIVSEGSDDNTIKKAAVVIEKNLNEFYNQAAVKIDFLSEVAYLFELLAEANEAALQRLSS